jgi:hypothetical protein
VSPPASVDSVLPEVVAVKPDPLPSEAPDAGVPADLAERFTFAKAGAAAAVCLRRGTFADTLPPVEDTFPVIVEVVTAADASRFDAADDGGAPDTGCSPVAVTAAEPVDPPAPLESGEVWFSPPAPDDEPPVLSLSDGDGPAESVPSA